jgi:uncharacterized protein
MIVRTAEGVVVCERCELAKSFHTRLRGLMGRKELAPGEGLWLRPSASIHTAFMRFPIDVVFLDGNDVVIRVVDYLGPWRMAGARGARSVLELAAGEAEHRGATSGVRLQAVA